jgi:receptor expression-enhancing protein 5/6
LNLEDGEAENRAKAERESWGENPFYDKNYRY